MNVLTERKAKAGTITGAPCLKTDWQTPEHLLDCVRDYFGGPIPLDPATSPGNPTKALEFFTEEDDGLSWDWHPQAFVNPPYGKAIRQWLMGTAQQATNDAEIIALLPCARWEQGYFHDFLDHVDALCFIRKRVSFVNPKTGDRVNGNPYANMFAGLNTDWSRFVRAFSPVGWCVRLGERRRNYE